MSLRPHGTPEPADTKDDAATTTPAPAAASPNGDGYVPNAPAVGDPAPDKLK